MKIRIYNVWTHRKFGITKGMFNRTKYVTHSAWIGINIFHREITLTIEWHNPNPNAIY